MLKQPLTKYKTIMLGNGTGSIFDLGCYLVSLCDGLQRHGYTFTPEVFNQVLKDKGLFIPTGTKNYIDVDNLAKKWPEVFVSFKSVAPFTTQSIPLDDTHVVVAKVDARPIGGTGSHFVEVLRMEGAYAIIGDPWFGDEVRAFDRYGKYGTLKELRIFEIKKGAVGSTPQGDTSMADTAEVTKLKSDLDQAIKDKTSLTNQVAGWVRDSQNGTWVAKADVEKAKTEAYNSGFEAGKVSVSTNPNINPGSIDMSKWRINGLQVSHVEGDKTITLNYDQI